MAESDVFGLRGKPEEVEKLRKFFGQFKGSEIVTALNRAIEEGRLALSKEDGSLEINVERKDRKALRFEKHERLFKQFFEKFMVKHRINGHELWYHIRTEDDLPDGLLTLLSWEYNEYRRELLGQVAAGSGLHQQDKALILELVSRYVSDEVCDRTFDQITKQIGMQHPREKAGTPQSTLARFEHEPVDVIHPPVPSIGEEQPVYFG